MRNTQIKRKLESCGEVLYAGIADNIKEARKTEEQFNCMGPGLRLDEREESSYAA